jgi:hypothetical protein
MREDSGYIMLQHNPYSSQKCTFLQAAAGEMWSPEVWKEMYVYVTGG